MIRNNIKNGGRREGKKTKSKLQIFFGKIEVTVEDFIGECNEE